MCAVTWKRLTTLSQPQTLLHITDEEIKPKTKRELPTDTEPVVAKPRLFCQRVVLWMRRKWLRNSNEKCREIVFDGQKSIFTGLCKDSDSQARLPIISTMWDSETPHISEDHPPARSLNSSAI